MFKPVHVIVLAFFILLGSWFLLGYSKEQLDQNKELKLTRLSEDEKSLFDFTLEDLDKNKVTLSSFKGKKFLLNFWTIGDLGSRDQLIDIEKLFKKYTSRSLEIITVNAGDNRYSVESFIKNRKYPFRVLLDLNQSVVMQYNVTTLPTTYLVGKDGVPIVVKKGDEPIRKFEGRIPFKQLDDKIKAIK